MAVLPRKAREAFKKSGSTPFEYGSLKKKKIVQNIVNSKKIKVQQSEVTIKNMKNLAAYQLEGPPMKFLVVFLCSDELVSPSTFSSLFDFLV